MARKFYISFPDGVCRMMRAGTVDLAIEEAKQALEVTNRYAANVLNKSYKIVATVYNDGRVIRADEPAPQ